MSRSDWLGLLAVCCVALFAYDIRPAASLLVVGLAAGYAAWVAS